MPNSKEESIVGYLVNGNVQDLHEHTTETQNPIYKNSIFGLEIIRHSCAHIMAQALQNIYKHVSFAIGPTTDNGFFYDFQIYDNHQNVINISFNDLEKIEQEMKNIIKSNLKFIKKTMSKIDFQNTTNDKFKTHILKENIKDEIISTYQQGDFIDLCRGPHVTNSETIGEHFKLISISEVSWKNHRMQRIEGICFATQEDLENYEKNKEKQQENDHRKLGKTMDLFSFSPLSPGCVFWHPRGLWIVEKIKEIIRKIGYKNFNEFETPALLKTELWQKTGHLANYRENMFVLEKEDLCMKPMNCPCHALLFKEKRLSYRDLPYRIAEFGSCFRNEDQGGVIGLKRVRKMVQDDGHIFCSIEHIESEIKRFLEDADKLYKIFGFKEYIFKIATIPEKHIGSEDLWREAEGHLMRGLNSRQYIISPGDGAFYGPKIEIHFKDNLGRIWQCGTIQVDCFLAERLEAEYIDSNSQKQYPIILHRAILGSLERFIAVLLENGPLPLWLQPVQMYILPISEKFINYANQVLISLQNLDLRAMVVDDNATLSKKLKNAMDEKIELCIIVGEKEKLNQTITIRYKNENITMKITDILGFLAKNHLVHNLILKQ